MFTMAMAIFKSVFKASLMSVMMFISIIRLGMIVYPEAPTDINYADAQPVDELLEEPAVQSVTVSPQTKRRIVLGQNTIENLGAAK